jgi:hypothetical protein
MGRPLPFGMVSHSLVKWGKICNVGMIFSNTEVVRSFGVLNYNADIWSEDN